MSQVARNLSSTFDAHLRTTGLTAARGRVLLFLVNKAQPVGQSEITHHLRVEGPTTVRILDGLEATGYVRRIPDPGDRRAKMVVLTETGRVHAEAVVALTRELEQKIMAGIDAEDIEVARRVVDKLIDNVAIAHAAIDAARFAEEVLA
jgi:MarR family transcriptional regulator for hemolysin